MSYEIKVRGKIGVALRDLAQQEVDRTLQAMAEMRTGDMAAAIHAARKRIKKIRAILGLLRGPLGRDQHREENGALRQMARGLAAKRDAEALQKTLKQLQRRFFPGKPSALIQALRESLASDERRAVAHLQRSDVVAAGIAGLKHLQERINHWELADYGWKELRQGVKRSYKRARTAYQEAHDAPTPTRLHRWRRRVKELWFHVRLLRKACPTLMEELAQDYEVLGEFLGDERDLFLLRDAFEERREVLPDESALETLLELIDLRREELLDAAFDLGARLHEMTAAHFAQELDERRTVRQDRLRKAKKLGAQLTPA